MESYYQNNFCIIYQGPLTFFAEIEKAWNYSPIIFSFWKGERPPIKKDKFYFLENEIPADYGIHNLYLQQTSTLNGLVMAKKLGFKKAIKIRSDMIPNNENEFVKLFSNQLNFLFWHDYNSGYLVDYLMGGNIDSLIQLWNFEKNNYSFPEQAITEQAKKKFTTSSISFIGKSLSSSNDILWLKNQKKISSYLKDSSFIYECKFQ